MPPGRHNLTSGDLVADRRAEYAAMLADGGDIQAAVELMEQALELAPGWAAGWFRLGEYREKAGLAGPAVAAYRRVRELAPDDVFGASLKLALLGETDQPVLPPSDYIEGLFDDYADRFDTALVEKLGYSVPAKLVALLRSLVAPPYGHVIDLGCGTGLFGAEIRADCHFLEGFDLSENMLTKAAAKGFYDHLARADLSLLIEESGLIAGAARNRANVVTAADVMIYLGDLEEAFANVRALMHPKGHFAFSVEKADSGYELRPSVRYAHSRAHVEAVLERHGMHVLAMEETTIRTDGGSPVEGLLFVARRKPG